MESPLEHKDWTEEHDYGYEYDEWLWEQNLEQGPPQDDDVVWLKHKAWDIGFGEGVDALSADEADKRLAAV